MNSDMIWTFLLLLPLQAAAQVENINGRSGESFKLKTEKTNLDDLQKVQWEKIINKNDSTLILTYQKDGQEKQEPTDTSAKDATTTTSAAASSMAVSAGLVAASSNDTADWKLTEGSLYKAGKTDLDQINGDLTLKNLDAEDAGEYKLTMTPKSGEAQTRTFKVAVAVPVAGAPHCSYAVRLMLICAIRLVWLF
ncbi:uncharacterized protein LOC144009715 [Festucalex cinctus]